MRLVHPTGALPDPGLTAPSAQRPLGTLLPGCPPGVPVGCCLLCSSLPPPFPAGVGCIRAHEPLGTALQTRIGTCPGCSQAGLSVHPRGEGKHTKVTRVRWCRVTHSRGGGGACLEVHGGGGCYLPHPPCPCSADQGQANDGGPTTAAPGLPCKRAAKCRRRAARGCRTPHSFPRGKGGSFRHVEVIRHCSCRGPCLPHLGPSPVAGGSLPASFPHAQILPGLQGGKRSTWQWPWKSWRAAARPSKCFLANASPLPARPPFLLFFGLSLPKHVGLLALPSAPACAGDGPLPQGRAGGPR